MSTPSDNQPVVQGVVKLPVVVRAFPRSVGWSVTVLFLITALGVAAALVYGFKYEQQTRHALCTLIGPALQSGQLPPDWQARYESVSQTYQCQG